MGYEIGFQPDDQSAASRHGRGCTTSYDRQGGSRVFASSTFLHRAARFGCNFIVNG